VYGWTFSAQLYSLDATAEDQLHSGVEQVFTALRPDQALRGHHSCPNAPSCALRSHVQQY